MEGKIIVESAEVPRPVGPYSQAVISNGFVFVSGQLPIQMESGVLLSGSLRDQTRLILNNIETILRAAGSSLSKVVKSTIFLTDASHFQEVNEAYSEYFRQGPPARSCVVVKELPKGAEVEIEVIAEP